jgi:hypothetical protein
MAGMTAPCVWCGEELICGGRGWIHASTGETYITRVDPDGVQRDDHCALPDLGKARMLYGGRAR